MKSNSFEDGKSQELLELRSRPYEMTKSDKSRNLSTKV